MARPLRIEYEGACYHVMNRGNARQAVFREKRDYQLFLEKLEAFSGRFDVAVRSYCLMPNHFHLYVHTADANLSRFMQSFLTSFTIIINRRRRSSGHVFQGRFKAIIVEDELYGSRLSRYIHLNPIRTRASSGQDALLLRDELRKFKWSSYRSLIGLSRTPEWLDRDAVLCRWGSRRRDQQRSYSEYVESGLLRDLDDPLEAEVVHSVLGSDGFLDWIRRGLPVLSEVSEHRRELSQYHGLRSSLRLSELVEAVSIEYGESATSLQQRYNRGSSGRQVLLFLASQHCRGRNSLRILSEQLGPISVGALSHASNKLEKRLRRDSDLRKQVEAIEHKLGLNVQRYQAQ